MSRGSNDALLQDVARDAGSSDRVWAVPGDDQRWWVPENGDVGSWSAEERPWRAEKGLSQFDRAKLGRLSQADALDRLADVGRDIGSAQRDAWLYHNAAEELKLARTLREDKASDVDVDIAAGLIVARLVRLGVKSATLEETLGGPPPETRSRVWRGVLNWLIKKLREIGHLLLNLIEAARRYLSRALGEIAAAITFSLSVGLPPAVECGVDANVVLNEAAWSPVRTFLDRILTMRVPTSVSCSDSLPPPRTELNGCKRARMPAAGGPCPADPEYRTTGREIGRYGVR